VGTQRWPLRDLDKWSLHLRKVVESSVATMRFASAEPELMIEHRMIAPSLRLAFSIQAAASRKNTASPK